MREISLERGASLKPDAGDKNYGTCLGIFGQKDIKTVFLLVVFV